MRELILYGQVGGSDDGMTSGQVADKLKSFGKLPVTVRVNSQGGSALEGIAIHNLIKDYPGKTTVVVDAAALSAASAFVMAGDEIHIRENAFFMLHSPSFLTGGNAVELRQNAALLDRLESNYIGIYTARTKQPRSTVEGWMRAEAWFNAEEAVAAGLADRVLPAVKVAACFGAWSPPARYGMAAGTAKSATEVFSTLREHLVAEGMTASAATLKLMKDHPDLHGRWVAEVNQAKLGSTTRRLAYR